MAARISPRRLPDAERALQAAHAVVGPTWRLFRPSSHLVADRRLCHTVRYRRGPVGHRTPLQRGDCPPQPIRGARTARFYGPRYRGHQHSSRQTRWRTAGRGIEYPRRRLDRARNRDGPKCIPRCFIFCFLVLALLLPLHDFPTLLLVFLGRSSCLRPWHSRLRRANNPQHVRDPHQLFLVDDHAIVGSMTSSAPAARSGPAPRRACADVDEGIRCRLAAHRSLVATRSSQTVAAHLYGASLPRRFELNPAYGVPTSL